MPKYEAKLPNPFYHDIEQSVRTELNARADYYGRKVRGIGGDFPKNVVWSYGKTAYALISGGGFVLGNPGSKVMSDAKGNLTLYNTQRNVPNKPLLTGLDLSNEGTLGSLLKGTFSFTFFPSISESGFNIEGLEKAFFTPGKEVTIKFGWSLTAASADACAHKFTGIISNFNWSLNPDLSISATVSIVSKTAVAMGVSGDMSTKEKGGEAPKDPLGESLSGNNLATLIEADLSNWGFGPKEKENGGGGAQFTPLTRGQKNYYTKEQTVSKAFDYYAISIPYQDQGPKEGKDGKPGEEGSEIVDKVVWFIKLGSIIDFMNQIIDGDKNLTNSNVFSTLFKIYWGRDLRLNTSPEYVLDELADIQFPSAYPMDVYFPHPTLGSYGTEFSPFKDKTDFDPSGSASVGDIGQILLSTDYVIAKFKEFVTGTATNISYKNVTNFFEKLIERINSATGDMIQLAATMVEDMKESDTPKRGSLVILNSNLSKAEVESFKPYNFNATIFKPLIKNVTISSHPPGPMAAAGYVQATTGQKGIGNTAPANVDVPTGGKASADMDEASKARAQLKISIEQIGAKGGFSPSWSESFRGNVLKTKRNPESDDLPWLQKAIYPVELTLTVDGISGFRFGDIFTTSLIPSFYNQCGMVFCVTKINHSIKDGVWETTLQTKSRIDPAKVDKLK